MNYWRSNSDGEGEAILMKTRNDLRLNSAEER